MVRILCSRSQILMRITRMSWAMAMSILRRFSICSSSLETYCTRVSLVTPPPAPPLTCRIFGDLLMGGVGVLDAVVEQGGNDRVHIQPQVGHDVGHRQGWMI